MTTSASTGEPGSRPTDPWWRRAPSHQLQKAFAWAAVGFVIEPIVPAGAP